MNTLINLPTKLLALVLSIGISVSLIDALSTGFTPMQGSTQGLVKGMVELPTVTVHGKRPHPVQDVLAKVKTNLATFSEPSKL